MTTAPHSIPLYKYKQKTNPVCHVYHLIPKQQLLSITHIWTWVRLEIVKIININTIDFLSTTTMKISVHVGSRDYIFAMLEIYFIKTTWQCSQYLKQSRQPPCRPKSTWWAKSRAFAYDSVRRHLHKPRRPLYVHTAENLHVNGVGRDCSNVRTITSHTYTHTSHIHTHMGKLHCV